ncbi:class I SAM-dependent methyltransferase [Mucilaginibacter sp. UR6-1]|uniref:class I SAM-dependent methyltransferase n=1 Tax=Mucilaginibacter sp. UR6-1 TaxID=1435643 RepID=UPI001E506D36|nr:class I SAM-dependent methyltransferase [Mucilaginibacter sp. UR6-1]MCC8410820.1 class I SAM-dependent methyltransferase [Mucilaginibacter sp. UR6-1]
MAANYNKTAWFYDSLARLVFGSALKNSQRHLLPLIPKNARVLIVGGGTGQTLEDLAAIQNDGLHITFVEISANMTALAQKRNADSNSVTFIVDAIEQVQLASNFDVIITGFLFDNYTDADLPVTFNHIHQSLKPGGLWLNTDFQLTGKWWQPLLLKTMYTFFRMFSPIPVSKLPDVKRVFASHGYNAIASATFYGDFILTRAYKKPVNH